MQLSLFLQEGVEQESLMHSKSGNIEFMLYDNANEIVHKFFESRLSRYQIDLETSIKGSDFIFE